MDTVMESDPLASAMQALVEPSAEPAPEVQTQVEAQPAATPAPEPTPQPSRTVPLPELMEERHKRQLAEREREAARRELELVQRFIEGNRQQQPQFQLPDPIAEPEKAFQFALQQNAALQQQMQEHFLNLRADQSEQAVRQKYQAEEIDAAVEAAKQAGLNKHFFAQKDPYGELMSWHVGRKLASEVGTDPQAYRQKIEAEVRERLLAEARAAGKPAPQNLPPSLSSATRASVPVSQIADDRDFFKSAFAKRM